MKNILLCASLLVGLAVVSCKKNDQPIQQPTPVMPDTLGVGWHKVTTPVSDGISDIYFNTSTHGYMLGDGIYRTNDGGETWTNLLTRSELANIAITPDNKAFVISRQSILRTQDEGLNFEAKALAATSEIGDVVFVNNNLGYIVLGNTFFTTANGGNTWSPVSATGLNLVAAPYKTLYFAGQDNGWIAAGMKIYRSVGTVSTWAAATFPGGSPYGSFTGIFAPSTGMVYASTDRGELFKSTDGGATFSPVYLFNDGEHFWTDLHFIDNNLGYCSSGRHLFKTIDGGNSWMKVASLGSEIFTEIHFTDAHHGWACGNSKEIFIYNN